MPTVWKWEATCGLLMSLGRKAKVSFLDEKTLLNIPIVDNYGMEDIFTISLSGHFPKRSSFITIWSFHLCPGSTLNPISSVETSMRLDGDRNSMPHRWVSQLSYPILDRLELICCFIENELTNQPQAGFYPIFQVIDQYLRPLRSTACICMV